MGVERGPGPEHRRPLDCSGARHYPVRPLPLVHFIPRRCEVKRLFFTLMLVALAAGTMAATSTTTTKHSTHTMAKMPDHGLTTPDQIQWGPAPAVFQSGAEMAVLEGNPRAEG